MVESLLLSPYVSVVPFVVVLPAAPAAANPEPTPTPAKANPAGIPIPVAIKAKPPAAAKAPPIILDALASVLLFETLSLVELE